MFYRKYCSVLEALHRNTRKGITILVFFIFLFLFSKKKKLKNPQIEEHLDTLHSNSGLLTLKFHLSLWMSITRRNRVIDYQRRLAVRTT